MSDPIDPVLASGRMALDNINEGLRCLLQARAELVLRLARHKRAQGLPIADAAREHAMLARLLERPAAGFDRDALERIFRAVFAESRQLALEVVS